MAGYAIRRQQAEQRLRRIKDSLPEFLVLDQDLPADAKFTFVDIASGKNMPILGATFKRYQ